MDIYIAICHDRHMDEVVRVFSTQEKAIQFCEHFSSWGRNVEIHELSLGMVADGWVYYATCGSEGDSVRVEKGKLDPND